MNGSNGIFSVARANSKSEHCAATVRKQNDIVTVDVLEIQNILAILHRSEFWVLTIPRICLFVLLLFLGRFEALLLPEIDALSTASEARRENLAETENEAINNNCSRVSHNSTSVSCAVDVFHQIIVVKIRAPDQRGQTSDQNSPNVHFHPLHIILSGCAPSNERWNKGGGGGQLPEKWLRRRLGRDPKHFLVFLQEKVCGDDGVKEQGEEQIPLQARLRLFRFLVVIGHLFPVLRIRSVVGAFLLSAARHSVRQSKSDSKMG